MLLVSSYLLGDRETGLAPGASIGLLVGPVLGKQALVLISH